MEVDARLGLLLIRKETLDKNAMKTTFVVSTAPQVETMDVDIVDSWETPVPP